MIFIDDLTIKSVTERKTRLQTCRYMYARIGKILFSLNRLSKFFIWNRATFVNLLLRIY